MINRWPRNGKDIGRFISVSWSSSEALLATSEHFDLCYQITECILQDSSAVFFIKMYYVIVRILLIWDANGNDLNIYIECCLQNNYMVLAHFQTIENWIKMENVWISGFGTEPQYRWELLSARTESALLWSLLDLTVILYDFLVDFLYDLFKNKNGKCLSQWFCNWTTILVGDF